MQDAHAPNLERVKKLKSDYDKLIQEVREDLLGQINRAISQLEEIGFHYSLQQRHGAKLASSAQRGEGVSLAGLQFRPAPSANFDPGKKCRICGTAGHDGRAHRRQRGGRKPFTFDELSQLGLRTPAASLEKSVEGGA